MQSQFASLRLSDNDRLPQPPPPPPPHQQHQQHQQELQQPVVPPPIPARRIGAAALAVQQQQQQQQQQHSIPIHHRQSSGDGTVVVDCIDHAPPSPVDSLTESIPPPPLTDLPPPSLEIPAPPPPAPPPPPSQQPEHPDAAHRQPAVHRHDGDNAHKAGSCLASIPENHSSASPPPGPTSSRAPSLSLDSENAAAAADLPPAVPRTRRTRSHTQQRMTMRMHEDSKAKHRKSSSSRRFSVSTLWSIANEQDLEVDDELTEAQKLLKDLKSRISSQSKQNFLLERDVRFLDSRIALLIQNRMALDEEMASHLTEDGCGEENTACFPDDRKKQLYGNLFFLLQTDPRLVAQLTQLVTLSEIDTLLQTVMFTLYGNQYDDREEHLLLTMFQSVLSEQFESATDFGSLLRANTPVSRMMTTYTRRGPGQQYLKLLLSDNINQLLEGDDINLEINPLKVYDQLLNEQETETGQAPTLPRGVTTDEAAANPLVQAILAPRVERLIEIANSFLKTIIGSLDQVPYGIRWICKQIKLLTKKKYPQATNWSICSLIGGFFFLRFINPAIVTPLSYMIIDQQPAKNTRRTLTLIAKMLQNLANKPAYSKEMYMMALNPFIDGNKERIAQFLDDLCNVDDFYESLELDQYMALSKKDISINVNLNEVYSTHALLLQHCDAICSSPMALGGNKSSQRGSLTPEQSYLISCHHLRLLLNDLAVAPAQVPRKDNKTLCLALFARWENAPILFPEMAEALSTQENSVTRSGGLLPKQESARGTSASSESALPDGDVLFLDTRALLIQIMRKMSVLAASTSPQTDGRYTFMPLVSITHVPTLFVPSLINIDEILEHSNAATNDGATIKRGLRARQNLRLLEDRYRHAQIRKSDGYHELSYSIHQEFVNLNGLLNKLRNEKESLEMVYQTICDHNQYLRSQLESYKAYLHNVRIQTAAGGGNTKAGKTNVMLGVASTKIPSGRKSPTRSSAKKGGAMVPLGPFKFSHSQLEKDGVITESGVPENRVLSPTPGSFLIGLHYKGREKPIIEVDLQLDDLLEKQQENVQYLDLEYVQLNVNRVLHLLNEMFLKR